MKRFLFFTVLPFILLASITTYSYPYLPIIKSFSKSDYKAGRQNWDIAFDKYGITYFGNNDGLLKHVGDSWELLKTSKNDNVKSIFIENDTIWVGGSTQFGFFTNNVKDRLEYHEISSGIKGQIWEIEAINEKLYAQTEAGVFIYNKINKTSVFVEEDTKGFFDIVNYKGAIWGIDRKHRIGYLSKEDKFIVQDSVPNLQSIQSIFIHKNKIAFLKNNSTIQYYSSKGESTEVHLPDEIVNSSIFSCQPYNENEILFGSITKGIYVYDVENKQVSVNISSSDGLMDNTVLAIQKDDFSNIWVGLDYGISYIESQKILKPIFNQGATYDFLVDRDTTLLATNKGVFQSVRNEKFHLLEGLHGQAWSIKSINGEKMICHNNGVFLLKDSKANSAFNETGVLDIANFEGTNKYIVSAYTGLLFMEMKEGKLIEIGNLYYWGNPEIKFDRDENAIWAKSRDGELKKFSLMNKGNEIDTEVFDENYSIFQVKGELLFYNNEYLLQYKNRKFKKVNKEPYSQIKGEGLSSVDVGPDGHSISYIQNGKLELLINILDGNYYSYEKVLSSLENHLLIGSEKIKFFGKVLWIPTDRGVEILNPNDKSKRLESPLPLISRLITKNIDNKTSQFTYPYASNEVNLDEDVVDVEFKFAQQKSLRDHVVFRCKLDGYDPDWSDWTTQTSKEYTKIKGGKYHFILQSKLNGGNLKETKLRVNVLRNWYETDWVYLPIFFLSIAIVFGFMKIYVMYTKRQIATLHKKQKNDLEAEKLTIKNEQLLKYTEMLTHKNAFLRDLYEDLENIGHRKTELWRKKIDSELSSDKKSLIFHELFNEVNHEFIHQLELDYPKLTQNEIRLASLIRFNLNNSEIANIMNITQKSVVVNRYRLKKKLLLENEIDLDQFIKNYNTDPVNI